MNYTTAANPVWGDAEHSCIDLNVTFEGLGTVPFAASKNDPMSHGPEIYARAVNGDFGTIAEYTETAAKVRQSFVVTRQQSVDAITVTTTAGNIFNGDEASQNRMARSIVALGDTDTVTWVLADNSVIQATKAELQEALKLSGEAQTALWVQTATTS